MDRIRPARWQPTVIAIAMAATLTLVTAWWVGIIRDADWCASFSHHRTVVLTPGDTPPAPDDGRAAAALP